MLASLGDRLLALPAGVALALVFVLPALESSAFLGFVFPGEIAVIVGGVLASQGRFPLSAAIAAAVLGAIIGDSVGYEVGKHWGDRMLRGSVGRLPIIRKELDKHLASATTFVRRRGPHAVFIAASRLRSGSWCPGSPAWRSCRIRSSCCSTRVVPLAARGGLGGRVRHDRRARDDRDAGRPACVARDLRGPGDVGGFACRG
jgi:membrane protein YqaA with SNARE-associated domain